MVRNLAEFECFFRPGDILKFDAVLPERFGEREGDEVSFQVLVKDAKRKVLPEVTDGVHRNPREDVGPTGDGGGRGIECESRHAHVGRTRRRGQFPDRE